MFTVEDNIFQTLGHSSVTQNLNKKSQLVTFTSVKLNERKLSHCNILFNYNND